MLLVKPMIFLWFCICVMMHILYPYWVILVLCILFHLHGISNNKGTWLSYTDCTRSRSIKGTVNSLFFLEMLCTYLKICFVFAHIKQCYFVSHFMFPWILKICLYQYQYLFICRSIYHIYTFCNIHRIGISWLYYLSSALYFCPFLLFRFPVALGFLCC